MTLTPIPPISIAQAHQPILVQHPSERTDPKDCVLSEIVQYQCRIDPHRILCTPIRRVFQSCAGKPRVEITPFQTDALVNELLPSQVPEHYVHSNPAPQFPFMERSERY
ncbi:uncharacterized protein BJ171DRAFT_498550 [Polychytrium aggregatum]|uniref:uncharacterized protein n=1 Tax=Polychytrium aggregatum TaxID=110093 RepID=UPI0022FEDDB5|nr:uncharacterized protein BJ171DRAFT_498550 [Polychytrium aggregatum]KAI9206056.1 hypothetical protein BJ171DRAFT_498550 [Polychytrium aggregatum]